MPYAPLRFTLLAAGATLFIGAACDSSLPYSGTPHQAPPSSTPAPPAGDTSRPAGYTPGGGYGTGPACDLNAPACADANALAYCEGDVEEVVDCDALCDGYGYDLSYGCDADPEAAGDACFCDYLCDDDAEPALCLSGYELEVCDGGTWEVLDCDAVCWERGFDGAAGCEAGAGAGEDACICVGDGPGPPQPPAPPAPPAPSCYEGDTACVGSTMLEVCEGGQPAFVDCNTECAALGYDFAQACAYDSGTGQDGCFCGEYVCLETELTCSDGSCVDTAYVCDGVSDCPNEDDEWDCPECDFDEAICADNQTLEVCEAGQLDYLDCDAMCQDAGYDFGDGCGYEASFGEDACFCGTLGCYDDEFTCGDGLCIPEEYLCDGYFDCSTGEDELCD